VPAIAARNLRGRLEALLGGWLNDASRGGPKPEPHTEVSKVSDLRAAARITLRPP